MYYSQEPYLAHYGVKGMRWGVRRGRAAVGKIIGRMRAQRLVNKANRAANVRQRARNARTFGNMNTNDRLNNLHLLNDPNRAKRIERARKAAIAGIVAAPVAGTAAGIYKMTEKQRNYKKQVRARLKRQQQRG